jgi:hypothetical protein
MTLMSHFLLRLSEHQSLEDLGSGWLEGRGDPIPRAHDGERRAEILVLEPHAHPSTIRGWLCADEIVAAPSHSGRLRRCALPSAR